MRNYSWNEIYALRALLMYQSLFRIEFCRTTILQLRMQIRLRLISRSLVSALALVECETQGDGRFCGILSERMKSRKGYVAPVRRGGKNPAEQVGVSPMRELPVQDQSNSVHRRSACFEIPSNINGSRTQTPNIKV